MFTKEELNEIEIAMQFRKSGLISWDSKLINRIDTIIEKCREIEEKENE